MPDKGHVEDGMTTPDPFFTALPPSPTASEFRFITRLASEVQVAETKPACHKAVRLREKVAQRWCLPLDYLPETGSC